MALLESEDDFVGAVLELCCLVFTFNSECHLNAKDMAGFYDHARHKYTDVFGIVSLFPYNFMTFIYTITRSLLRRPRGCKKRVQNYLVYYYLSTVSSLISFVVSRILYGGYMRLCLSAFFYFYFV